MASCAVSEGIGEGAKKAGDGISMIGAGAKEIAGSIADFISWLANGGLLLIIGVLLKRKWAWAAVARHLAGGDEETVRKAYGEVHGRRRRLGRPAKKGE